MSGFDEDIVSDTQELDKVGEANPKLPRMMTRNKRNGKGKLKQKFGLTLITADNSTKKANCNQVLFKAKHGCWVYDNSDAHAHSSMTRKTTDCDEILNLQPVRVDGKASGLSL